MNQNDFKDLVRSKIKTTKQIAREAVEEAFHQKKKKRKRKGRSSREEDDYSSSDSDNDNDDDKKKKPKNNNLIQPTSVRTKTTESKYRDRALERREGKLPETETTLTTAQEDLSEYLGGDEAHTHLVKGLDKALARSVKDEIAQQQQQNEEQDEVKQDNPILETKQQAWEYLQTQPRFHTTLARSMLSYLQEKQQRGFQPTVSVSTAGAALQRSQMTFAIDWHPYNLATCWEIPVERSVAGGYTAPLPKASALTRDLIQEIRSKEKQFVTTAAVGDAGVNNNNNKDNNNKKEGDEPDDDSDEDIFPIEDAKEVLPQPRRRSGRNTNRIQLSASRSGALQFRRLEELFLKEDESDGRHNPKQRCSRNQNQSPVILRFGKFSLERLYFAPNIYIIDNFLSPVDLEYLQQSISARQFQKSFVDNDQAESILDDSHRTSTFLSFGKQENAKVASIEQKAAELMGCYSTDQIEPLQLVRYLPGQFFGVHHDMGDYNEETGEVALPAKSVLAKRRLVTIFCYLNDLPSNAGGCTGFPACDKLRVRPKAGRAVVFCNVTADGLPDPRTIHAGEVVVDTTKQEKPRRPVDGKEATSKDAGNASNGSNDFDGKRPKKVKPPIKYGLNIWICEP